MKSQEVSAKTIEEAISLGLEQLGASISDVTVDILEEGSKGLFGLFGSRPAKVRLTLKEEEPEDSLARDIFAGTLEEKPAPKPAPKAAPQPKQEKPAQPAVKPQAPKAPKPVLMEEAPKAEQPAPEKQEKAEKPAPKPRKPREPREPKEAREVK